MRPTVRLSQRMLSAFIQYRTARRRRGRALAPRMRRLGILCLSVAPWAVLVSAPGCAPSSTPKPHIEDASPVLATSDGYVGSTVCAPCHPGEAHDQARSRHARTMHSATLSSLGELAPASGPIPGTKVAILYDGDNIQMRAPGMAIYPEYVLGSGKTGMTYLLTVGGNTLVELRGTYFPRLRKWTMTPGQMDAPSGTMGRPYSLPLARKCLSCHTTHLPQDGIIPESRFLGITCEVCHGPGEAHVKAMYAGDYAHPHMDDLSQLKGPEALALCGRCHRTAADVKAQKLDASATQRFQPYGLALSLCYRRSNGRLTCMTCHDPHTDADAPASQARYVSVCLSCHAPGREGTSPRIRSCPIKPDGNCLPCHMPRRRVFARPDIPTEMPDHFIRVFRRGRPGVRGGTR